MNSLKIVALTHKNLGLQELGRLHLEQTQQEQVLLAAKEEFQLKEFMYLSTCNRVEFTFSTDQQINSEFLKRFFLFLNPSIENEAINVLVDNALIYVGESALEHAFRVASSLDSLIVGEREIITQVRKAYENCNQIGLTGDTIRLVIKQSVATAKEIYTQTNIAKNPVSIVSLAYRKLRELGVANNARIIFVGAGETNVAMAQYLKKHEYANFVVFNRSKEKAERLALDLKGQAFGLDALKEYNKGFDVLISCTSSQDPVITEEVYESLLAGEKNKKIIIDLAIPSDVDTKVKEQHSIDLICIEDIKASAQKNLKEREKELAQCKIIIDNKVEEFNSLFKERQVELAFGEVPKRVKEIRETALNEVFAKDIGSMDENSKEILEKVMFYMEKKYNSVTMKMAKQILLDKDI